MGRGFESLFRHHHARLATQVTTAPLEPRPAWWVRAVAALPLPWLYGLADLLAFLAYRVFPYRALVVRENLHIAFPSLDESGLRSLMREYYSGFAQVLMEIAKSPALSQEELRSRVTFRDLELARSVLAQGRSAVFLAAHQCNWEWMLLALSVELGFPLD